MSLMREEMTARKMSEEFPSFHERETSARQLTGYRQDKYGFCGEFTGGCGDRCSVGSGFDRAELCTYW